MTSETTSSAVTMMIKHKQRVVDSLAPFQNQEVLKDYMVQQATGSLHIGGQEEEKAGANKLVWCRHRLAGLRPYHHHHGGSHDHDDEEDDDVLVYFQDVLVRWNWDESSSSVGGGQNLALKLELEVAVATLTSLESLLLQHDANSSNNALSMPKFSIMKSSSSNVSTTMQISLQIAQVVCFNSTEKDTTPSTTLTTARSHRPLMSSMFRSLLSLEFLLLSHNRAGSAAGTNGTSITTQVTVGELLVMDNKCNAGSSIDSSTETLITNKSAIVTAHNVERLDDSTSRMDGLIWRNNGKKKSDDSFSMGNDDSLDQFQLQARNLQLAWTGTTLFVHIQSLDDCSVSTAVSATGVDGKGYEFNDHGGACYSKLENTKPIGNVQLQFHHHHAQSRSATTGIVDEDLTLNLNEGATFCASQQKEKVVEQEEEMASGTPSSPLSRASLSQLVQTITLRFVMISSKNINSPSPCWSSWKPPRKIQLESKCFIFSWYPQQSRGYGDDLDLLSNDATLEGMELTKEVQHQLILDQFSLCIKHQPQALQQTGTPDRFLFALQVGKLELVPTFNIEQFQVSGYWADGGDAPSQDKLELVSVDCGGPMTIETTCDAKPLLSSLLEYLDDSKLQAGKSLDESWNWLLNIKVPHASVSELKYQFQPKINDDCLAAFQGNIQTTVRMIMQHYTDTLIDRIQISEQRFVHRVLFSSNFSRVSFSDTVATTVGRSAVGASIVAPIGLVASVAAVGIKDGVQSVAAAGKEHRGAQPDDSYKFGDVGRGIVAGVQNVAARGRRSRGASADDTHKLGDFVKGIGDSLRQSKRDMLMKNQLDAVGDDDETALHDGDKGESYFERNKARYGSVVGSSLGAVAGLVVMGPIGMVAGSLAGGVAAASYIERSELEKSTDGKTQVRNDAEQQSTSVKGETMAKTDTVQSSKRSNTVSSTPATTDSATEPSPLSSTSEESSRAPMTLEETVTLQTSATAPVAPRSAVSAVETLKASRLGQFTQGVIASGKKATGRDENSEYKFGDFTRGLWTQKK